MVLCPNFQTFKEPKNQFQGTNSARLCSPAGRYDNPIPTRFQAPHGLLINSSAARLNSLAELIPWNRFLGSLNIYKYGLWY
jgi:hypothetical protein